MGGREVLRGKVLSYELEAREGQRSAEMPAFYAEGKIY